MFVHLPAYTASFRFFYFNQFVTWCRYLRICNKRNQSIFVTKFFNSTHLYEHFDCPETFVWATRCWVGNLIHCPTLIPTFLTFYALIAWIHLRSLDSAAFWFRPILKTVPLDLWFNKWDFPTFGIFNVVLNVLHQKFRESPFLIEQLLVSTIFWDFPIGKYVNFIRLW